MEKMEEDKRNKEVSLDDLLMQQHKATKQLLEAQQILQIVLQVDQRVASAWGLWGHVLQMMGNEEKASEVILTSLEWNQVNSFDDYSLCSIII